ncbi:hypothetical protein BJ165DRAFT_1594799 [Panaeolus papilionaceus]|nr:hypothetical protein BJ165DRAFT_1594799 [Panaeolus papilionaceus]
MDPNDDTQPIFPWEVFSLIVDGVAHRSPELHLEGERLDTLRACALVCKSFLPLSRAYTFETVTLGFEKGRESRVDRLISVLEGQPILKTYIRHLVLGLPDLYYQWPPKSASGIIPLTSLNLDSILGLPNVHTISCLHHSVQVGPEGDGSDLWCHKIIEGYARIGTLRNLVARSNYNLPFEVISKHTALHSLRLDCCWPPPILSPTIKHLALISVYSCNVSILSYFPNLEVLEAISTEFLEFPTIDGTPPFGLKSLILEQNYLSGPISNFPSSSLTLVSYFRDKAREYGVQPFAQLTALSITFVPSPQLSEMVAHLIEDSPVLRHFSFQVAPIPRLAPRDFVARLRNTEHTLSFLCVPHSYNKNAIPQYVGKSLSIMMRIFASPDATPSFSMNHIFDDATGTITSNSKTPAAEGIDFFMETWKRISSLVRLKHTGVRSLEEVEVRMICLYHGDNGKGVKSRSEVEDLLVSSCGEPGIVWGIDLEDLDDPEKAKATVTFVLDHTSLRPASASS